MPKNQYYTEAELKKIFTNLKRKGFTDVLANILISHTFNRPVNTRTSGFYFSGGPDATLAWNNATRTVSLTPVDPGEPVYDPKGNLYVPNFRFYAWDKEARLQRKEQEETLQIPAEEGLFLIHFGVNQTTRRYELLYIKNPEPEDIAEIYIQGVPVAWVYWDAIASEALYFGDSRHGSEFNPQMHWQQHQTLNSRRQSGLALTNVTYDGDGDLNGDYQFGISAGELWHDDIFTATNAVGVATSLPVWYFDGAGLPRFATSAGKKFLNTGTGRVAFNGVTGGLAEAPDMHFVAYHLFATNCQLNPHISVMGQASFDTLGGAVGSIEAEVATLRQNLPHSNLMHIGSFVLQTSDAYTNSGKTRVVFSSVSGEDTYVTDFSFDNETREITLSQNNKADFKVFLENLSPFANPDGFWYGGFVTHIAGLTFSISECGYYMQGNPIVSPFSVKTLDPADPTYDRIDVFAVDITGSVVVIKGTPAAEPQKPSVDPTSQLELTFVLIPALATEPIGITDEIIYDENIEWTPTFSGFTVNFNSSIDPFNGSICANISNIGTADSITFTAAANKNFADYETLTAFLKLKEATTKQHFLLCEFLLSGVPVSDAVILLSTSVSLAWQSIAVPLSAFQLSDTQFDAVRFRWSKSGQQDDHAGFYLDLVKLEKGITQPEPIINGKDGATWYSGTYHDPLVIGAKVGDFFLDTGTILGDIYKCTSMPETWTWQMNIAPRIGVNGNWYVNNVDTGIKAEGDSAYTVAVLNGFIGTEAEWLESLIGPTGARGADGTPGAPGADGITPHIGLNGNWYIDTTDTGIPATGEDGREVEFRENAGWVEWRYVGDVSWTQLYEIPTGGGTDEKVKYDASDPTAGYLADKIVAGTNVTIEEGTGADENKAKISVSGLGSISTYDIWVGTQVQYDAIVTKDANTIYHIEEE